MYACAGVGEGEVWLPQSYSPQCCASAVTADWISWLRRSCMGAGPCAMQHQSWALNIISSVAVDFTLCMCACVPSLTSVCCAACLCCRCQLVGGAAAGQHAGRAERQRCAHGCAPGEHTCTTCLSWVWTSSVCATAAACLSMHSWQQGGVLLWPNMAAK